MNLSNLAGETFGIELEVEDIVSDNFHVPKIFNRDHDASIEGISLIAASRKFTGDNAQIPLKLGIGGNVTTGVELVSTPINFEEDYWKGLLKTLLVDLTKCGERDISERASIHVHVYCPVNRQIFQNILKLGRITENLFFRIGGMGYKHRGISNDYAFCRPLVGKGPHAVHVGRRGNYGQCLNLDDILSRDFDMSKLVSLWGDIVSCQNKYVPVRYLWLNPRNIILALFGMGNKNSSTLEFRIFNKSLNFRYLLAIISLCCEFVKVCMGEVVNPPIEIATPFDVEDSERLVALLHTYFGKIDASHLRTLEEIINLSPAIAVSDKFIFSHLITNPVRGDTSHIHWENSNYRTKPIDSEEISKPHTVDVHLLKNNLRGGKDSYESRYYDLIEHKFKGAATTPTANPNTDFDDEDLPEEVREELVRARVEQERRNFEQTLRAERQRRETPRQTAGTHEENPVIQPMWRIEAEPPQVFTQFINVTGTNTQPQRAAENRPAPATPRRPRRHRPDPET